MVAAENTVPMYSILMPSQMPSGMWHQAVAVVVSLWTCSLSPAALLVAGLFLVLQTLGLRRATAAMRRLLPVTNLHESRACRC